MGSRRLFFVRCTPEQWYHYVENYLLKEMKLKMLHQPHNMSPHHHSIHLTLHNPTQPTPNSSSSSSSGGGGGGLYDVLYTVDFFDTLAPPTEDAAAQEEGASSDNGVATAGTAGGEETTSRGPLSRVPMASQMAQHSRVYLERHFLLLPTLMQVVETDGTQLFSDVICDALKRYRPRQTWTIEGEMYECEKTGFILRLGRVQMASEHRGSYVIDVEEKTSQRVPTSSNTTRDSWWKQLIHKLVEPFASQRLSSAQQQTGGAAPATTPPVIADSTPTYERHSLPDRYTYKHLVWGYTTLIMKNRT